MSCWINLSGNSRNIVVDEILFLFLQCLHIEYIHMEYGCSYRFNNNDAGREISHVLHRVPKCQCQNKNLK